MNDRSLWRRRKEEMRFSSILCTWAEGMEGRAWQPWLYLPL